MNFVDPKRSFTDRFVVDTGATDTLAPARLLRQIGIKPVHRRSYKSASGRKRHPVGHALIGFDGDEAAGEVVFGNDKDEP